MNLKYPWLLLLFIVYLPIIYFYLGKFKRSNPYLEVSTTSAFVGKSSNWKVWMIHGCFFLRLLAIGGLIIALCRPQVFDNTSNATINGTDIVVALDISGSMEAPDLQPSRYDAAKKMASQFVEKRENDNVALVAFAGESLTFMPLTSDKAAVLNAISNLRLGMLGEGTAIGDGLVSSINRVLGGKAKSKSIILLTDGTNNAGEIDPMTAAKIARDKGVKVYTIGVGSNEVVPISTLYGHVTTQVSVEIDEKLLSDIAQSTGGKYFRATETDALRRVFDEIDALEKTKIDVSNYSSVSDNFLPWVLLALGLFVLELIIRYTTVRRIP